MAKTHKDYELELLDKELDYVPLENYSGAKTPIMHECFNGHKVNKTPTSILQGTKCPICVQESRASDYILKLAKINKDLEVLEPYIDSKTPILHRHIVCGYEWSIRPDGILYYNYGCPQCSKYASPMSNIEYLNKLNDLGILYTPLEAYINYLTPILHKCYSCDNEWNISPAHIIEGRGCPLCNRIGIYNSKYFKNNTEKANSPGTLYLVVLVNKKTSERECLKIGITKGSSYRNVIIRGHGFKGYDLRIQKIYHGTLKEVWELEQALHAKWAHKSKKPSVKFGGYSECFEICDEIIATFPKNNS